VGLSLPPSSGDELDLLDIPDVAGNVSGAISSAIIVP
jgi:hypothetical protein